MIWIVGGTGETSKFIKIIEANSPEMIQNLLVSVATSDGKEFLSNDIRIHTGRMDEEEMLEFVKDNEISICIDLSHPHARIVSRNAETVCRKANIKYIRYQREAIGSLEEDYIESSDIRFFEDINQLLAFVSKNGSSYFITTGVNNVRDFEKIRNGRNFTYRVLPSVTSMKIMRENNVPMNNIIGILGPVDYNLNLAMMQRYKSEYLVMKDSGKESMAMERIDAARKLGMKVIVLKMTEENSALRNLEMVYEELKLFLSQNKMNERGEINES